MPPKRARKTKKDEPSASSDRKRNTGKQRQRDIRPSDIEIKESFRLFTLDRTEMNDDEHAEAADADPNEEDDFMRVLDVRRALSALDLPRPPADFFEPDQTLVSQGDFEELAKTMRDVGHGAADEDDEDEDAMDVDDPQKREIDHAFALFTTPVPPAGRFEARSAVPSERRITLADLRRVAQDLREKVDENVMRMMIEEANGEEGPAAVAKGVSREAFEDIMRRAGVFN